MFGPGSPLQVIGHRGAAAAAPENTLPSFRHAVRVGADAVELDLHVCRSGELVVIHDPLVDRTTEARGAVADLTLDELQALDAGYRFTPDRGRTFPFRGRGVSVPTLAEVLDEVGELPVVAEVKSAPAGEALGDLLANHPAAERILVGGFSPRAVEAARAHARWTCAYTDELRPYVLLGKVGLAGLAVPRVDAAMVPPRWRAIRVATPRFVRRAHRDGLGVFVWTVNEPRQARKLFEWGVDGLVTDAPARIRRLLEERTANETPLEVVA